MMNPVFTVVTKEKADKVKKKEDIHYIHTTYVPRTLQFTPPVREPATPPKVEAEMRVAHQPQAPRHNRR